MGGDPFCGSLWIPAGQSAIELALPGRLLVVTIVPASKFDGPNYGFFTMISAARSASALMVREGFTPSGVGIVAPSIT